MATARALHRSSADHMNKAVTSLRDYSKSCNLALNSSMTDWMLISTPQMARFHRLEEQKLPIACGDTRLKRISCTKLLGVHMDQNLTWKTHVDHVLNSSYGILSVLRRLKNLAPFICEETPGREFSPPQVTYAYSAFHFLQLFKLSASKGYKMHAPDLSQEGSQEWRTLKN